MNTSRHPLRVAIAGAGTIGTRRARVLLESGGAELVAIADASAERRELARREFGVRVCERWEDVVRDEAVEAVIVATTNDALAPITAAALERGRHVLCEKPAGRSVEEARRMAEAAERGGGLLAFGFNHRHTDGMVKALAIVRAGGAGTPLVVRARYGHGARPGFEREWRADPARAGGGELLDQGVHLIDLARLALGDVARASGLVRTLSWPIEPLEDNAFALLEHGAGGVTQFHVSLTQWKNLFSFEIYGDQGSVTVEGLGGSYGPERVVWHRRRPQSGPPLEESFEFDEPLGSWRREWRGFLAAVSGAPVPAGAVPIATAADGIAVMETVAALYASARSGGAVACGEAGLIARAGAV